MAEIAEALAAAASLAVKVQERPQRRNDLVERDEVFQLDVESIAERPPADEDGVLRPAAADDADVALIGPGAAVGAAGHADADGRPPQVETHKFAFQFVEHARKCALRLGQSQTASRNRRAGQAELPHRADAVRPRDAVSVK